MRSATWITVIVGLFMFQSLWNVAAAFCVHEDIQPQSYEHFHFGHHQNTLCVIENNQYQENNGHQHGDSAPQKKNQDIGEDHQDHLPSMTQLIVQDQNISFENNHNSIQNIIVLNWNNNYQSPDLFQQSPPPEFTPLMVG